MAASKLGRPLLPWQQHVANVALEIDPATGRLAYRQVVVTIPRQSGKTTGLLFTVMVLRCLTFGRRQRIVYTAQDRNSAREKFTEEFVPILRESPGLREGVDFKVREANGSEAIEFLGSGSTIKISATLDNSGHGRTLDMPGIDEAFEHKTTDVEQGFRVPMITRPEPQLWVLSTAGDERSLYLDRKRAAGRASVEAPGSVPGLAYFEWSAEQDGGQAADLLDRALWWRVMPALGHTISEAAIAAEIADMDPADARRAYLNVTQHRLTEEPSPISVEDWGRLVDTDSEPTGRLVYGIAVSVDRQHASIGVAAPSTKGGLHVELVAAGAGTGWVVDSLVGILARHGGAAVAVDPGSPAGSLVGELERALAPLGVELVKMSARDHAAACGALVDRVSPPDGQAPGVRHIGQVPVDAAVAGAKKRNLPDAWALDRKKPDVDISPLESIVMALGGVLRLPDEVKDDDVSVYAERGFAEW